VPQLGGVRAPPGREIIRSPPRKEWVNPVRRVPVPAETADDLQDRVRPPAAARQPQEAARGLPECRGPTRQ
jgi:hypothetical protein